MSERTPDDHRPPVSRRSLLASALAAGTVGALAGAASPAGAADLSPREPEAPWIKGSGLRFTEDWVPLPEGYPWRPGRMLYYTVIEGDVGELPRRQWAVVFPDGTQRPFPEEAFVAQLRMAFAERGWQWVSTNHPAATHVTIYLPLSDFRAAGLMAAPSTGAPSGSSSETPAQAPVDDGSFAG